MGRAWSWGLQFMSLKSMSPSARVTARRAFTRLFATNPPACEGR